MKRAMGCITMLVLLFALTACTAANPTEDIEEMYIQTAQLTAQEQSILDFAGAEKPPYILDFQVDETVQSLQINIYELQNGQWQLIPGGGGEQLHETSGRIALTFDNIGFGVRTAVEHKGASSYAVEPDFDFDGLSTTTSYLTDQTAIEYEKEIPLVIQIHAAKNEISSLSPEYGFYEPETYAESGYEKVYAITCMFRQKAVNEP